MGARGGFGTSGGGGSATTNASDLTSGTLAAARLPALTGDATSSAGSAALTMATVNAGVGAFGGATKSLSVTANAKGLVTAIAEQTVTPAISSITGFGAGIATALAIAIGSAGAPVVNAGALGTPSSGNLSNCTALPVGSVTGIGTVATLASDTDTTLAANSDVRIATQKAVKAYIDGAVTGLLDFKGSIDASSNPNHPAASKGDAYYSSVAGKVGGASGKSVEIGDVVVASADNAGGTEASVGTSWFVLEHNLVGAVINGGTLGTPSSGVATNLTGLPVSTGISGLGAGVATALAIAVGTAGSFNPMTTGGDLTYGGASGVATRLANGSAGQYLQSNGTTVAPSWATPVAINNMTDTWNAAGTTYMGIKLVVTDTGHAAASRLISLQIGGIEEFAVDATGHIYSYPSDNEFQLLMGSLSQKFISGNFTTAQLWSNEIRIGGNGFGPNSQEYLSIKEVSETTVIAASATSDTVLQIPAGVLVLAVSVRVTTVIPTATSFSVGDSGSATRYGTTSTIGVAATTTDKGTAAGAYYNPTATSIRYTMNGGTPAANTGRVKVIAWYVTIQPPQS